MNSNKYNWLMYNIKVQYPKITKFIQDVKKQLNINNNNNKEIKYNHLLNCNSEIQLKRNRSCANVKGKRSLEN